MAKQPNILTRSVATVERSIRTKLLIAFMGITCLLIALTLFGLNYLQQANARTEALIEDQKRIEYFNTILNSCSCPLWVADSRPRKESGQGASTP